MSVYKQFYKSFISKLPDRLVESFGGYFIELITRIVKTEPITLPVRIGNLEFENPVGMPAGWADTPSKLRNIYQLGAGVVTSKTITLNPKVGNPYPRIIRGDHKMINSMGLPNHGAMWWYRNFDPEVSPSILSIKGNNLQEWEKIISLLDKKADILELNFSCPNVGNGIMDMETSKNLLIDIASISSSKIFLKISPRFSPQENRELIDKIRSVITGVTAINTYPVKNTQLGNPSKIGGLSGKPIFDKLRSHLLELRKHYPTHSDLPIFATGGIMNQTDAWDILTKYNTFPLNLTAFFIKGPLVYQNITSHIKYKLEEKQEKITSYFS